MLVKQEQQLHRVVIEVNRVLDTDNEGGKSALAPHRHAVGLAHVQAAENPLLKSQDLVHIVEKLDAELIELSSIIVANLDQCLLVDCKVSRKLGSPLMKVKFDDKELAVERDEHSKALLEVTPQLPQVLVVKL